MTLVKKGVPLSTAALKAGMSEPTARKHLGMGRLPSQLRRPRDWRTRTELFEEVWPEVKELLERDAGLQAKTVFEELGRRYPGRFQAGQLRTLQRRFRRWRALRGPPREVYFRRSIALGSRRSRISRRWVRWWSWWRGCILCICSITLCSRTRTWSR